MYTIKFTGEFKRQMKLCERRGYDMELLRTAIRELTGTDTLSSMGTDTLSSNG